ncbi:hypothetical protein EFE23_08035 [Micromonospora solifontis]|uniref:Transmembrane protein n=1 Tax=Micromonospora solifontis TaxID=2487138 RepID=A0ABX9WIB6_9ACTN|nr:hypothetical protein EFE23_08035 [Micromonospora solifontis]
MQTAAVAMTPARRIEVVRLLVIGAVVTLVARPVTWMVTFGFLGPGFGWFDYAAWAASGGGGRRAVIVMVWALPAVAVVVALKVAQQVHRGSARAACAVPALGFIFLSATVLYLISIAVVGLLHGHLVDSATLATAMFVVGPVVGVHLYLLRLCWRIWRWRPGGA